MNASFLSAGLVVKCTRLECSAQLRFLRILVAVCLSVAPTSLLQANQNWDGDNAVGNFSFNNNWFGDNQPGWGSGNLSFNFRNNAGQASLFYDYAGWVSTGDIIWEATFNAALTWNGNGNGINFNQRLENRSSQTQTVGTMNLSGASSGAGAIELNPVNGDLILNGSIFNDNNKSYFTYGDNNKMLTIGVDLVGNSNVGYTLAQYSKVKITAAQTFGSSSAFNINEGELWLEDGGNLATGMVVNLGLNDAQTAKFYLSGTADYAGNINVANGSGGTKVLGGLTSDQVSTFGGNVTNNSSAGVLLENTQSGGTAEFSGVISGTGAATISGSGRVLFSGANTYSGGTTLSGGTLQFAKTNSMSSSGTVAVQTGTTLAVNLGGTDEFTTASSGNGSIGGLLGGTGGQGASVTYAGAVTLGLDTSNSGSAQTYSSVIANVGDSLGINKLGSGSLTLSGIAANTYTGLTTVSGGTLELSKTDGVNAIAGATTIKSGAILLLSASDQVDSGAGDTVTLSGGTIQRASGVSEVFGNLNVTQASVINYSAGTGNSLTFTGLNYTPSSTLKVELQNFTQGSTLVIQNTSNWASEINNGFTFAGSGGFGSSSFVDNGEGIGTFTITAIPEPSTYVAAAGLLAMFLWPVRRRVIKDVKSILGLRPTGRERIEAYRKA